LILYLDTSAWVKLYVEEVGSDLVRDGVRDSDDIASHLIAYVELRSALARKREQSPELDSRYAHVLEAALDDWKRIHHLPVDEAFVFRAAELAEHELLRGYDAVHLAAADRLRAATAAPVIFASFDHALNEAARRLGFETLGSASHSE
jgi:predicted nucleic acid-binding protein